MVAAEEMFSRGVLEDSTPSFSAHMQYRTSVRDGVENVGDLQNMEK